MWRGGGAARESIAATLSLFTVFKGFLAPSGERPQAKGSNCNVSQQLTAEAKEIAQLKQTITELKKKYI